ncbi:MAG TPA: mobile mystery protein A [Gammaproteobacteria bacterium]|nr:anaerobic benzoate catabolism transcriptional regulator [bacterium BMS3Abin11]HDH16571.1 mobile mystery protein A [Gammaproteobacteria bacterium]
MRSEERIMARRQLDTRLSLLSDTSTLARPPKGWIKAIREALGMTTSQLGKRMGVSQPRAVAVEKAEANSSITLDSLERAAHALDCHLVYALVPKVSLDEVVKKRAALLAKKQLDTVSHTMALEAQGMNKDDEKEQFKRLVEQLTNKSGSDLWQEEN